jgi:hypothetical protein
LKLYFLLSRKTKQNDKIFLIQEPKQLHLLVSKII